MSVYLCIDLKSFYASVECAARGLDPMTARLVVADPERSDKTICLAVSPALKALGVKNRCRVFEIPKHIDYIMAPPRMQRYIDCSAEIYGIYLRYIAPEDIHVYSVDEAFLDVTRYLKKYGMTARELARHLMKEILDTVGVPAACGIGPNLYLTKIALDITAKHASDFIGELDEEKYRQTLWDHRPLTDFWRVGKGLAARLESIGLLTMRQIAHADEDSLYRLLGVDAELLIDHAWGREPVTIADIQAYTPKSNSLTRGQVLMRDYSKDETRTIVREMADGMCLELAEKGLVTGSVTLVLGYTSRSEKEPDHGSVSFAVPTSADRTVIPAVVSLFERIADPDTPVRRLYLNANRVEKPSGRQQLSFFGESADETDGRDRRRQETILGIKKRFGKNSVFRGMDLLDEATARERNRQIGGHKSGE